MPLSDLVSEDTLKTWPAVPQLHPHEPGSFDHLITLDEVESLIDTNCLPCRSARLIASNGRIVSDVSTYSRDGDTPIPGALRQHLDNGGSISLRLMETTHPALSALYRELRKETGCTGHISGYLTPPGNQGFRYHYDPYTSIIVQIAGTKAWPLLPPVVDWPVEEYGDFRLRGFTEDEHRRNATTAPTETYTLSSGDVLWLPQGWVHSPHNYGGDRMSFHLTIALKPRTLHWAAVQIANAAVQRILDDPACRQPLTPATLFGEDAATAGAARARVLEAIAEWDDNELGDILVRTARPELPSSAHLSR